ncbi:Os10g0330300 [Oryza sativa Japonica Group]|uniref:Os10g0330300 protein n=1 Tax=Oryza sativa subsp. japonica TaxID=39947 RepID=Q7G646_ORYSJ|nr:unknown protein [Oryza sativa Japonica Group]AAN04158.1 Unknown protein [Oryza sativa Japonica Group]BAF26278.1 Os10g0330300 [Oryza sativa Japonica Group]|eukprot:NP_001064364.1 Os10g0330300 [Oryza sativa Japonica Group]
MVEPVIAYFRNIFPVVPMCVSCHKCSQGFEHHTLGKETGGTAAELWRAVIQ